MRANNLDQSTPSENPPNEPPSVRDALSFYEKLPTIYAASDRWLTITHAWIKKFVLSELGDLRQLSPLCCLNLGSGALSYGIPESAMLHVDIHAARFSQGQNAIVADIQRLPPFGRPFDWCLCVGSVLNHCDAAAVIASAQTAVERGGRFLIEFETSRSLELLFSKHFGRSATVIETFYQDQTIRLWAYSEAYVRGLLAANDFVVTRRSSRHHLSPLLYLLSRNSNFAARMAPLDHIARHVPILRACASHVIFACRKAS